uniref:Uncharacterized protein n=1 Tax=Macrostomum lignano TaxID=282301 RepID=A0A1I8FBN1_9PLAT
MPYTRATVTIDGVVPGLHQGQQVQNLLVSAQTEAHTASECVWTFAVDCKPVLVRADNRSLACTNRQNEEEESTDLAGTSPANPTTSTAYMEPETSTASIEATAHWPDDNVTDFVTPSPSSDWSNETQCYIKLRLFGGWNSAVPKLAASFHQQNLSCHACCVRI